MFKALHLRDDIDRLYMSRKEGGIRLTSVEDYMNASIRGLTDSIKRTKERLLSAINSTDDIRTNGTTINRKQKLEEKQLYGCFKQQTGKISHRKTWRYLREKNLQKETESLLIVAQNNTIRTNYAINRKPNQTGEYNTRPF